MTRHAGDRPASGRRGAITAWASLVVALGALGVLAVLVAPLLFPGAAPGTWAAPASPATAFPPAMAQDAAAELAQAGAGDAASDPVPDRPPVPGQPIGLSIPAVGLSTAVRAMDVAPGGVVDPPGPTFAYWLSAYGVAGPAAGNTVYIAGHTFRGGGAVFNPLLDVPNEQSAVAAGDAIAVETPEAVYDYVVTDVQRYDKASVDQQSELWEQVPGRLVLVTCFQYDDSQASTQNLVIFARLAGS
ncbi:class F sortase [Herbiconiux liangxiaofengii]|uniref:class F sortase n=1 Tax=Herbiconiux liangxiaofengii TaxID=3342795 RepID=UPI0035B9D0D2